MPPTVKNNETIKRRWLPRFSLRSLMLGVCLIGSGFGLWWRWAPWVPAKIVGLARGNSNNKFDANYLNDVLFASSGERLLLKFDDHAALCDAVTGKVVRLLSSVNHAAFSPDGTQLTTVGNWINRKLDAKTGLDVELYCECPLGAEGMSFPAPGQLIAFHENNLIRWDLESMAVTEVLEDEIFKEYKSISPNGRWMVFAVEQSLKREFESWDLWDLKSGTHLKFLQPLSSARSVALGSLDQLNIVWSTDSTRFAIPVNDNFIHIWDVSADLPVVEVGPIEHGIGELALGPRGELLVIVYGSGSYSVWDTRRNVKVVDLPIGNYGTYQLSPDGRHIVVATLERIIFYDTSTGKVVKSIELPDGRQLIKLAFSPDGRHVLGLDNGDGQNEEIEETFLMVWDVASGTLTHNKRFPSRLISPFFDAAGHVGFCYQGNSLSNKNEYSLVIQILDLKTLRLTKTIPNREKGSDLMYGEDTLNPFQLSRGFGRSDEWYYPLRNQLLRVGERIEVWDVTHRKLVRSKPALEEAYWMLAVPNSSYFIMGSNPTEMCIVDLETLEIRKRIPGYFSPNKLGISANGQLMAYLDENSKTVHVMDCLTWEEQSSWDINADSLRIAPDGQRLLSWEWGNPVTIWDIATGKSFGKLDGHFGAFAGDRRLIYTAKNKPTIDYVGVEDFYDGRLWDSRTLAEVPMPKPDLLEKVEHHLMTWWNEEGSRFVELTSTAELWIWKLRRPWPWYGFAWLWEFWGVVLFGAALLWSLGLDWKRFRPVMKISVSDSNGG